MAEMSLFFCIFATIFTGKQIKLFPYYIKYGNRICPINTIFRKQNGH